MTACDYTTTPALKIDAATVLVNDGGPTVSLTTEIVVISWFCVGDNICGQYKIQKVASEDATSQVVYARRTSDDSKKAVRIITRARFRDVDILDEVGWLQTTSTSRENFAKYFDHYNDIRYFYIAFDFSPRSLKNAINDTDLHFSRRHVIELSVQILQAVQHLHNHSIFHLDLDPESFEVVEGDAREPFYDRNLRRFRNRKILKSSKIRLLYYGKLGGTTPKPTNEGQYKSPESVYGFPMTSSSDVFTAGCIIAEILTRKPLFPPCPQGRLYMREKTVAFAAVIGPFPETIQQDIHQSFSGIFKYPNSDSPEQGGLTSSIREFCKEAEPLKYTILEEYALDTIENMISIDPERRLSIVDIFAHPFFDTSSL